jgi:hypothetical protein
MGFLAIDTVAPKDFLDPAYVDPPATPLVFNEEQRPLVADVGFTHGAPSGKCITAPSSTRIASGDRRLRRHSVLYVTQSKGVVMNGSTIIWGILGIVLLLVVLRVFGLL